MLVQPTLWQKQDTKQQPTPLKLDDRSAPSVSSRGNNRGEQRQSRSSFTKTGFGQTAAIGLPRWHGPLPCGSGCTASNPANGFTPLPAANVSHHYVYRASNATGGGGTYAHGPMLYYFGGLYVVSWQGAPIDEGANTGPRFPPQVSD